MNKNERIQEILNNGRRMSFNCWNPHWRGIHSERNKFNGIYKIITKYFNKDFVVAEIGAYEGNLSEFFALHCKEVHCIDPWDASAYVSNEYKLPHSKFKQCLTKRKEMFYEKLKKYPNIKIIEDYSYNAHAQFPNHNFDCVYIDGNHSYEVVKSDIIQWKPKVKIGGILSGHDYDSQVQKAVEELLGKVETFEDSSWVKLIE